MPEFSRRPSTGSRGETPAADPPPPPPAPPVAAGVHDAAPARDGASPTAAQSAGERGAQAPRGEDAGRADRAAVADPAELDGDERFVRGVD